MMIKQPATSSSDSSADVFESSAIERIVGRLRKQPYSKVMAVRYVLALLIAAGVVEFGTRYAADLGLISTGVRDLLGFVPLACLWCALFYVLQRVHTVPLVRATVIAGMSCAFVFQISDFIDEIPAAQHYPLFAKNASLHRLMEQAITGIGGLLLLASFCFALLENEEVLRELNTERKRLFENIAERRRAKRALKEAHRALEAKVQERTAALAALNEQLRVELSERKRAEATLANRLRTEEGLASCSHALLASTEPEEALNSALHQLLTISGASRVYIFENRDDPALGLCMEMTHHVWDPAKTADICVPGTRVLEPYRKGFERWYIELSQGRPITGPIDSFPENERVRLAPYHAMALLLLPIGWEGHWQGFLGFDDVQMAHGWTPEELRMLQTAAEMVSACRERQRAEESLRLAYDSLERRVAERTADLTRANEQLQQEIMERHRAEQEKARLESQLIQGQKMQAIGTLAGGIAHDFNNILSSILGYSELGMRKLDPESPFQRHFQEILKAGNRAKELVRQILIFSRQSEQERTPVHLHLMAKEAIALMRASTPANIEIRQRIESNAGAVLADPGQMHQVILNLCTNAQHAMRKTGGILELRVEPVTFTEPLLTMHGNLEPGDYVKVAVSDTGHGMDASTMERIFEPFFTTKGVGEGTGMGLAILHGIIIGLRGAVTVESTPGKGSTFSVYLPRYQGAESEKPAPILESLRGTERILVVDDEQQLVNLWIEILGGLGYQATPYSDSLAALASFRADPSRYDAVLLDQTMPNMTGAQLARIMLEVRPELPIILATGFSEAITPEEAQEMGIRDFVYKPILGNDLGRAVRRALDGTTTVPEGNGTGR